MSSSASASRARLQAGRTGAALVLALVLALANGPPLVAQEAAVVASVVVRVDGRPGEAGLLDLIPIQPGDGFSPRLVDQAVKQIFRTGLFADVRVTKQGEQRIDLFFDLARKVFINAVRFRGPKFSATRLRESLTVLRPGAYLQEDRIPDAVKEVQAGLRQEGFFDAVVVCDVKKSEGASSADLVFRVLDWKTFRIGGLEVEWKSEIPERALLKKMKSKVGDLYRPNRLAADLQALSGGLDRSGYPRAEVRLAGEAFDEESRRVDLRIEILPNEKITIVVNGAKIPARILAPIWEERVFEQWGLSEGEARILNYVRRQGYLFATVQSRVEKDRNELRIIHDVTRGEKSKITGVEFRGNSAFSSLDLRTRVAVREGVPLFSLLKYDKLFSIPRELESFYKDNGFAGVQVRLDLARDTHGVRAVFDIQEGPKTMIEAIRIQGTSLVSADALARGLVSREGGPFFPPNVQRDVGQIETYYLNSGIRGTEVVPRVERLPGGQVALAYEITEGTRVNVRDVFITGNRTTHKRVIGREIRIKKGAAADFSLVQESKQRLERLGLFSEVRVDEVQTGPADEVVIVTVREGEKNYVGVGLGIESRNPVTGSLVDWLDFRPRGTVEYIRSNIFGLGAQVGVLGQISTIERRAVLSWNQPYFLGLSLPTAILGWAEREARTGFTFDRRGVSLSAAKPLTKARLLLGSLSLTRTSIVQPVDLSQLPPNIDRQFLPYSAALASLSMSWERRDDTLNPTRGWFLSAVGEIGVPVFGTEANYQKLFVKSQLYRPLTSGLNLGLIARLGLGNGLSHLPERFFAGGSNTFRGEEFEMLGPIAPAPADPTMLKPYGGEAVFLVNTELTFAAFPAWKAFRLASFFDLGNVYETIGHFRPLDLRGAAGAGIRYRTPLGPVRVEIAWKLWGFDVQDKKGHPLIFLTIGNIF
ncbi:MAG: POTRA domain-containing protein [Candidatus Aminicenantales bacterium]